MRRLRRRSQQPAGGLAGETLPGADLTEGETFPFRGYDIPIDLMLRTGGGPDTFAAISQGHINNLNSQHPLSPGIDVFEMGCGIGRDAIPLSEILVAGSYVGSDVIRPSVEWCRANITRRHPNIEFVHQDVSDDLHNPRGELQISATPLPVADASRDLVFAQSVFTHLLPAEFAYYLREVARIVRPGGTVYLTVFRADDEILRRARQDLRRTPYALGFRTVHSDGCWINDPKQPTGAVAYREDVLRGYITAAGLRLRQPILTGSWSGYHPVAFDGQDVLVLESAG